ncbi:MAG: PhnD/SsuA/transferrin family substrate-binding protein [Ktedonobacteraceae bacterium]|nr:PhnD/SsuA/transferrin family substrate-binding protein [Ktedonobacteraceae bacterium]
MPTLLLNGESLDDFAVAHADAGIIGAHAYMQLLAQQPCAVEPLAVPVLKGMTEDEALPTLIAIVVHRESTFNTLSDLERHTCTWAYHSRASHIENQFLPASTPFTFNNGRTIETASQAGALRLVLDREADVTAIDACLLALAYRNSPRMTAQLRVLCTCSSSTHPLVVVAAHVSSSLKQKMREAFLQIHHDSFFAQQLDEGAIERFIPVPLIEETQDEVQAWQSAIRLETNRRQRNLSLPVSMLKGDQR